MFEELSHNASVLYIHAQGLLIVEEHVLTSSPLHTSNGVQLSSHI